MRRGSIYLCVLALLCAGCATSPATQEDGGGPDPLCAAMKKFAEAVPADGRHEVTLLTDWDAEPTRACQRTDAAAEKQFCAYLVEGASIEFMGANVERALNCAGMVTPYSHQDLLFGKASGAYRTRTPAFTKRRIELELDFDNTPADGLPHLTIAVRPLPKP